MAGTRTMIVTVAMGLLAVLGGALASTNGQRDPEVIARILAYHNNVRADHGASPLTWSSTLAKSAQSWTDQCNFSHDLGTLRASNYGENLAQGFSVWQDAVKAWTDEAALYDYNNPTFSSATGHFTQVVWKSTTQVGCANTNSCGGGRLYSCRYFPAGNYLGQFQDNVSP
jgi:uncharacterized protein YkwD